MLAVTHLIPLLHADSLSNSFWDSLPLCCTPYSFPDTCEFELSFCMVFLNINHPAIKCLIPDLCDQWVHSTSQLWPQVPCRPRLVWPQWVPRCPRIWVTPFDSWMIDSLWHHRIRILNSNSQVSGIESTVCSKAGESLSTKSWTESLHVGEGLNGSQLAWTCYR